MQESELTGWYPGVIKPVRVGVYQRKLLMIRHYMPTESYSLWNGCCWNAWQSTPDDAMMPTNYASQYQELEWRGLCGK